MIGPSQRQAIRSMLNPVLLRYLLGVANRRSASYRATFGGTSVSFDDHEELVRSRTAQRLPSSGTPVPPRPQARSPARPVR
jgi:hypothetical protein